MKNSQLYSLESTIFLAAAIIEPSWPPIILATLGFILYHVSKLKGD